MNLGLQISTAAGRQTIFTPFGIRFWDPALDSQVDDGLTVTAIPLETKGKATLGLRTGSGIYAFHGLPGLHDVEYPADASNLDSSPPFTRRFIVWVVDNRVRFLTIVFSVDLPFHGIYPTDSSNSLPGFYLFSAPTRPSIPTLAIVRAQLIERPGSPVEKPAAHAVLEILETNNRIWYGIADERGSVVVMFPYPTFTDVSGTRVSPPVTERQQQWEITVRVRYTPTKLAVLPGSRIPELHSILGQIQGTICPNPAASAASLSATLTFGEELILRTGTQSVLWIQSS
jgi:hypothetical protein